jgi:phage virion morphogenesis protein
MIRTAHTDDLAALEPWLDGVMSRLEPAQRTTLSRRIGMLLRRVNAARVTANIEPDGDPMAPRKPKAPRPTKVGREAKGDTPIRNRGKRGAMFRRIELARNMVTVPGPDQVLLTFKPRVAETAAVHHFGEVAPVNPRLTNSIRVRYTARRLLGFGPADSDAILAEVMAHLDR